VELYLMHEAYALLDVLLPAAHESVVVHGALHPRQLHAVQLVVCVPLGVSLCASRGLVVTVFSEPWSHQLHAAPMPVVAVSELAQWLGEMAQKLSPMSWGQEMVEQQLTLLPQPPH